ncbi:peptidoglycan DD-metalloendopeptidase family protein [Paracoccaceae bacterium]|nr:peptidoglycan DD-metalloendopeptidase family protein [Paracoccaceae bacterium]
MQLSLKSIQAARVSLIKAASDRADLPIRFIDDPKKISLLSKSAKSLGEFAVAINSLEKKLIVPVEPTEKDFEGALNRPVEGVIARKFKEEDAAGIVRPGIIIRTKDNEIVTAPIVSTILYAGPLLDYKMVSILEPDEGVLLIFAGLDQVFVKPGQIIPKSGPIGLMGSRNTNSKDFITGKELNSGRLSQSLYIEVRVNDKPQDPFDWFDFNKE